MSSTSFRLSNVNLADIFYEHPLHCFGLKKILSLNLFDENVRLRSYTFTA